MNVSVGPLRFGTALKDRGDKNEVAQLTRLSVAAVEADRVAEVPEAGGRGECFDEVQEVLPTDAGERLVQGGCGPDEAEREQAKDRVAGRNPRRRERLLLAGRKAAVQGTARAGQEDPGDEDQRGRGAASALRGSSGASLRRWLATDAT
jgi:hypothetical protein